MCVGPELALAAEAIAPEVLGATAAAGAGEAAGGALAAEAGSGAFGAADLGGLVGAEAMVAGADSELLAGLGAGAGAAGAGSSLLSMFPTAADEAFGGLLGPAGTPWLSGTAAADAVGGLNAPTKSLLNAKNAQLLGRMAMQSGGQQQPQGAPADFTNPNMRAANLTQEQITKKWLLKNDPRTYTLMYGAPPQGN